MKIKSQHDMSRRCPVLPFAMKSMTTLLGLVTIVVLSISLKSMTRLNQSALLMTDNSSQNDVESNAIPIAKYGKSLSTASDRSPIRIVFFAGTEGTGHHFWQALMKESPVYQRLLDLDIHPLFTRRLIRSLYRHKKSRWKGLWSGTCKWSMEDPPTNVTEIHETIVDILRNMTRHVEARKKSKSIDNPDKIPIPINLLGIGQEVGFVSYPGFLLPCRALNYPNLDVWYAACETAQIQCQHVYQYRNPYAVVRSTTSNRQINAGIMDAIHLYTTQLHILHTQLLSHPRRLVGCWDYDAILSPVQFQNEINPLFQFPDAASYKQVLQKILRYKKPPTTKEQQGNIVPPELDLYMQSMVHVHDMLVQTCQDIRAQSVG